MQQRPAKFFLLLALVMIIFLLTGTPTLAADDAVTEESSGWRLLLHSADGSTSEEILQNDFSDGKSEYTLESPYIPLRLLAQASGTPLGWYKYGDKGAAIWAQREVAVVLLPGHKIVLYVLDAAEPQYTQVYTEQQFEEPLLLNGSVCVPLSFLDCLGLDWQLDTPERQIIVWLPASAGRGVNPDLVRQAAENNVREILTPKGVMLGSATTTFDPQQENRSHNIFLAASSLHGAEIAPGKVFSFNQTVGERTAARGYRPATIFSERKPILGLGGGVCQVSTTLYQAVLQAKLTVLERHPHSLQVSYAAPGSDAAVYWGTKDLRWQNNTEKNIYLVSQISGGKLTIEIWQGSLDGVELPEVWQNANR
jgi:hypothetical protein